MINEGVFMSKNEQFEYRIISDFMSGKITRNKASELIGKTERSITRIATRVRLKGMLGIKNANLGKVPVNKICNKLRSSVLKEVQSKYFDFNMTHCLEKLHEDNRFTNLKYPTFRRWCHSIKFVKRKYRKKAIVRKQRVRMPSEGLMLQMDGSHHCWVNGKKWCLIAAIDDATSDIPYAEFFLSEDTLNCMTVMQKIFESKGIPETIYVDKAGCLGGGKRGLFNQFKRACEELGVRIIFASSPQAKGRIERTWDTFQDRIIPELRLKNIDNILHANLYMQTEFIPNYWKVKNTVTPYNSETKYRPVPKEVDLNEVFCIKEHRVIGYDHTFNYKGSEYIIDSKLKHGIHKQRLEIRTYQDLTQKFFFANKRLDIKILTKSKLQKVA